MKHKGWRFMRRTMIHGLLVLSAVCILSFLLVINAPVDPLDAYFSSVSVSREHYEIVTAYWGLDKPPLERFMIWLQHLSHGDWGESFIYRRPVIEVVLSKFQSSLLLMLMAWSLSGAIGFILGVIAGVKRGKMIDRAISYFSLLCMSIPLFWLGLLFLMIFSVHLGWFPLGMAAPIGKASEEVTYVERLHHMILPAFTLAITGMSSIIMQTRQKMIEVLECPYMVYATSRGETLWRRVYRHGIRNVIFPAITLQFASFGELFGGTVLAETVFSYPGIGSTATMAGLQGDVSLLLAIAIFSAFFVFVGNTLAEMIYIWMDPMMGEERL